MNEAASIGVIGGADGPTALFVTGDPLMLIAFAVIGIALICLLVWKMLKK